MNAVAKFVRPEPHLARYEAARRALAEARSIDEVKEIHDKSEAIRAYAKQVKDLDMEMWISEIHIRAEQRLGELLTKQPKDRGGGDTSTGTRKVPVQKHPKLADLNVGKKLSARAQKIAALPGDVVQTYFTQAREKERPAWPNDLLRFYRKIEREQRENVEKELEAAIEPDFAIHHCAIEDVGSGHLADASVDAIVTDPPYPQEYLPTFSRLSTLAERTLKPSGWCVVMTGAVYLPEVIKRLSEKLTYRWQYVITTPGGANARMSSVGLFQGYKPVLLFQKPPVGKIREWWSDVLTAEVDERWSVIEASVKEQDKSLHPWQQSERVFSELVKRFSRPGDLVVDPFAGSGTTGRAAKSQGRHFWGCDIDEKYATEKRQLKEMLE